MRVVPMMREYTVFNIDQCEKLPERVATLGELKPRNSDERDAAVDEFLACSGATIREGNCCRQAAEVSTQLSFRHFIQGSQ
jgi:antirestriction protein ArdC